MLLAYHQGSQGLGLSRGLVVGVWRTVAVCWSFGDGVDAGAGEENWSVGGWDAESSKSSHTKAFQADEATPAAARRAECRTRGSRSMSPVRLSIYSLLSESEQRRGMRITVEAPVDEYSLTNAT